MGKKLNLITKVIGEKALTLKEKLGPIATIFIIGLTAILFLRPALKAISTNHQTLTQKEDSLTKLENKRKLLKTLQVPENEQNLDNQLKLIARYIPSTKPSLQTLISLISLARSENVQFSGVSVNPGVVKNQTAANSTIQRTNDFSKEVSAETMSSFDLSFSIIGRKQNLENFITKLKELAPMMRINKFSTSFMSMGNNTEVADTSGLLLNVTLNLKVYYQQVPDKLPAYEEPLALLTQDEQQLLSDLNRYIFAQNQIPTVENIGQGGDLGNQNPFKTSQTETPKE